MKLTKILILLLFLPPVLAWTVKYPIINYQTSDGLPQNQVNTLIQDDMGYIYVGTQSGIGKFDGTRFEKISVNQGLINGYVNDFSFDHEGNLWVATQSGLSRLAPNGRIKNFLSGINIKSLDYDFSALRLWVIGDGKVYYSDSEEFKPFEISSGFSTFINSPRMAIGVTIGDSGTKYFYSTKHIVELTDDRPNPRLFEVSGDIKVLKWLQPFKKIVICTSDGIFIPADHSSSRLVPFISLPGNPGGITDIVADENLRLWVATNNGLYSYNHPSGEPIYIGKENGLPTTQVNVLLLDRERNLFVGSRWGLSQVPPNLIRMYDESSGLPSKYVWGFEEINGEVLIACDSGVAKLDPETNKITAFHSINSRLRNESVRTITRLGSNEILLGCRPSGVYRWDSNNKLEHISSFSSVYSAIKTGENTVWFGCTNGLLIYENGRFRTLTEGLKSPSIYSLAAYDKNTILVGTAGGIQKIQDGRLVPCELEQYIPERTAIVDIRLISREEIIVATLLNGVFILKNNRVRQITTKDGMLHNDVWSVIKDDFGNLWLNTSVSLDRYSDGFISHFNKKSGLFGDEGSVHSALKSSFGNLYFGIVPGFIEIPAQSTDVNIKKPILYITSFKVNEEPFALPKESKAAEPIILKHSQNSLELQYIAVSARKENPVIYKTRLLPLDEHWSAATRETFIKYPKLPPDEYTFEVIANNGGGEDQWFTSRNKVRFTIEKPYWLKWWFIFLVALLITLAVFFIHKLRVRSMEKQKKQLEELVEERTKELEYLSITDPLTDLKNRRYLEEKIKEDISLIERGIFARTQQYSDESETAPILGVFILDIDYFKRVNDDYGHKAGDIVIVDIARMLIEMLRNSDTIVRWGGEEFLIITWQKTKSNSFELAERIRKRIENFEFRIDDSIRINKTVSVGFAHFPFIPNDTRTINWSQVVSLADSALYLSKNNGRNMSVGLEFGGKEFKSGVDGKAIVSDIKKAIEKGYLKLIAHTENLEVLQHNR